MQELKGFSRNIVEASASTDVEVLVAPGVSRSQNEVVFFFKPEVFLPGVDSLGVVESALTLLNTNGVRICGCAVMPGAFLEANEIMDAHYGFINRMSRSASSSLSSEDMGRISSEFGESATKSVVGGHEFLKLFPHYSATTLDALWAGKRSAKLRSGLYVQVFEIESGVITIVNGFHPAQLAHFTGPDRRIAVLILESELPWKHLRSRVLGDTFPERALLNTIRQSYYARGKELGMADVSIANNCVHMSAGPFEAAFELENFFGRTGIGGYSRTGTSVFRKLGGDEAAFERMLTNPRSIINGVEMGLFDATEECDTNSSVGLYRMSFAG